MAAALFAALESAANIAYNWALKCWQATVGVFKSVWKGLADLMSNVKDMILKLTFHFCYSDHTTTTSTSQNAQTNHVQVRETNVPVEVKYNVDDNENQLDPIQEEKRKKLQHLKEARAKIKGMETVVDEAIEIMEEDYENENDPAESAKTTDRIQQLLNRDDTKKLIEEIGSAPGIL